MLIGVFKRLFRTPRKFQQENIKKHQFKFCSKWSDLFENLDGVLSFYFSDYKLGVVLIRIIFALSYIKINDFVNYLSQHFENVRKGLVWACSRNEIVVEIMKGHVNHNTARVFEYYYDEIIVINKKRSKNYWRKIKWFWYINRKWVAYTLLCRIVYAGNTTSIIFVNVDKFTFFEHKIYLAPLSNVSFDSFWTLGISKKKDYWSRSA